MRNFMTMEEACLLITDGTHYTPKSVETGVPFLTVKDMYDDYLDFENCSFISETDFKFALDNNSVPRCGDILFSKDGTVGKVYVVKGKDFAVLSSIAILRPDPQKVFNRYLAHMLKAPQTLSQAEMMKTGSALRRIILKDLKKLRVSFPPLPEQKRIAAILDKADAVRRKRQETIRLLDEFLRSVFLEMFGDPVRNEKGWEVVPLGQFINFITSGSRGWARYYSNAGEKFIRIQNVTKGRLLFDSVQYVNAPETQEAKRTRVRKGDLLISITADLGRTAVVDEKTATEGAYINQHLCLLRLNESVNPIYISRFLESEGGRNQFKMLDQIGVKSGLNFDSIKSLKILNPPIDLQNKFVKIIKQTDKQRDILIKRSLSEMENGFDSMMKKAFWGEL
jgi:type I restriction enzyme S subunit